MQDFTRIGGAITSAPLNDNFRRLLNDIDMTNTNIIWDDKEGIVETISDLMSIDNPKNGQACYVISSGELYRYYSKDNKWHKIMDLGSTFRQGFLNSGAVVLDGEIKYVNANTLKFPNMLIYFKNAPGDDRYLKGMYLIEECEQEFNITEVGSYSVFVNKKGEIQYLTGLPIQDNPNEVFLGTFIIYRTVTGDTAIAKDFIYTLPDMAYTADRGNFFINGGQASGLNLDKPGTHDNKAKRTKGYYYDEGINYPQGDTAEFPYDCDNSSNYDLKIFDAESPVPKFYYVTPKDGLTNEIKETSGLISDKYYNGTELVNVEPGYFTIQEHIVTPTGQNIILYGTSQYNSKKDAEANINGNYEIDVDFPYAQATRIIIGNLVDGDGNPYINTDDENSCQFYKIGRLTQVGTISPVFADKDFRIYSGDANDNTPATIWFDLKALQDEDYSQTYDLRILPYNVIRHHFYNDVKYITDSETYSLDDYQVATTRTTEGNIGGYYLADDCDVVDLRERVNSIEKEIWDLKDDSKARYNQSIRYRLFTAENRLDDHKNRLDVDDEKINWLEQNKVFKQTTINGYTLGDTDQKEEIKNIVLYTDDILEKDSNATNKWYTEERVSGNTDVVNAKKHIETVSKSDNAIGHTRVNPHNISTDDISILEDTSRLFVSPDEERRIRADKLPEDTIKALQDLDEKNMDSLHISYQEGSSQDPGPSIIDLGDAKKIRFYQNGVKLDMDSDGETAIIECIGQVDDSIVMYRNRYATLETEYPDLYGGYVDKAVNAEYAYYVGDIDQASASQYYGTNADKEIGIFDLPKYVSSADAESYASIDQVTFEPIDGSVQEKHLETTLKDKINNNYHAIFDGGVLSSAEINTIDFGNNLHVVVSGHKATINATSAGEPAEYKFTSLEDVDVTYTNNEGKMVIVNSEGTGLTLAKTPSTQEYMLRSIYVEPTDVSKVKKAVHADNATTADTATNALAVNNKSVDNSSTTEGLWTASKIISNTSSQIAAEGVNTYSGTTVPANTLGKNGDIYILIES